MTLFLAKFILIWILLSWTTEAVWSWSTSKVGRLTRQRTTMTRVFLSSNHDNVQFSESLSRRSLFRTSGAAIATVGSLTLFGAPATASTADAEVTDKIFIEIKGLQQQADVQQSARIVIGLFGKDAPQPVSMLKQLVSKSGLPAPCKPKESRALQREQLEANKVYNSCVENQDKGVSYDLSTVWRIIKDERIDIGSVSGKFVSRQYPTWEGENSLLHDAVGVVSVRRGNEGGFGFTIFPGGNAEYLDQDHIVVGRVIEGMEYVQVLNDTPVVTSAKVNYMALTGGPTTKSAPTRACRYGGPMYCNENKPLQKLNIIKTGVL